MLSDSKIDIKDYVLLDSSYGYGNFLKMQRFKEIICADIDDIALRKTRDNFKDVCIKPLFLHTNSLVDIQRKKFIFIDSTKLVIIGNPPYNYKIYIVQNRLNTYPSPAYSNLKARDIDIILRSFDELMVDYICILHPLYYLIKKSNNKALKSFIKHYRLTDSMIVNSQNL